nr:hypothetical protein 19 [Desulfobacterales bacterium]
MKRKIYTDRHRLVISTPRKGQPPHQSIYLERRCGLSWPTAHNPGYFVVVGLLDIATPSGEKPIEVITEGERPTPTHLFERLVVVMREYSVKCLLANMRGHEREYMALGRFMKSRNIKYFSVLDTVEFSGLEESLGTITDMLINRLIRMDPRMKLFRQIDGLRPEDLKSQKAVRPEERLHAYYAFSQVVTSFQVYPYRKPLRNRSTPRRRSGYGG